MAACDRGVGMNSRTSWTGRVVALAITFGSILGAFHGTVAHAGPGNCSITPQNSTSNFAVGKTMSVSYGGSVVCFDQKSWIQFYGNLYTESGFFLDSFSLITYGINTNDHIQNYSWNCVKKSNLKNQPQAFKIVLGYFATPWVGQQAFDEKTYHISGPCPLIRA